MKTLLLWLIVYIPAFLTFIFYVAYFMGYLDSFVLSYELEHGISFTEQCLIH